MHSHKLFDYDCIMQNPVQLNFHLFRKLFEVKRTFLPATLFLGIPNTLQIMKISQSLEGKFPETPTGSSRRFI